MHACRYIEFQNTYKIDNDKMNYKDKVQSTTILTKSYYTKNPLLPYLYRGCAQCQTRCRGQKWENVGWTVFFG
jgi:hypothetical protein